ncbi:hypothetical protein MRB53_026897 [Persea americana]|uniref:Uncharacterized protein n=1 Tax=Persea americana TaxID=3435 RepID=A0ACC2LKN0_PERAE|nr:hypothetical protein MRB53_026897 [Persea americana]|eukprot:TRINITY_DN8723_c0_g5_i4.p1 TRINITY_DN8723_c0_g5~~TRINITY_DN8723_c0_g5_i4.p1  ORF type:complete len:219 (+),score=43.26 TRINITY_DN8723_c0_g5_i4:389-1045(+)
MGLSKEKKPNKILRGLKTLFFLMNMLVSLLLFSAPVLLVVTDALIPSALLSAFVSPLSSDTLYSLLRNYDFQASIVDIPLISIARSLVIICVYSVCDGPKLSHGPYLGVTTLCSLISVAFVSLKACVYGAKINGGKALMMRFQRPDLDVWATEAMFLCSLILAVGHILVAYRTSCRERRKLLVYRIDLEAVSAFKKGFHVYQKVLQHDIGKCKETQRR